METNNIIRLTYATVETYLLLRIRVLIITVFIIMYTKHYWF